MSNITRVSRKAKGLCLGCGNPPDTGRRMCRPLSITDPPVGGYGGVSVAVVPGNPGDQAFVYATWLQSYRKLSDFAKPIPSELYFLGQHDRIERLLSKGRLDVAVPEGETANVHTILGYCLTEGTRLHWLYVKGNWRRMGVASRLLAGKQLSEFTHWTYDFDHLAKRLNTMKYNPYAAGG